jgi:hypothetical protein
MTEHIINLLIKFEIITWINLLLYEKDYYYF